MMRSGRSFPRPSRTRGGDYSIFLDEETLTLFAVQKLTEGHTADSLPSHPVVRKWWDFMADIMEVNVDNSPVCKPLAEVFHAD